MFEYMLLCQAREGKEVAAAELLLIFERYGQLHNDEVQEAVVAGAKAVAGYAARTALQPPTGQGATINPLKFFVGVHAEKRGPKEDPDSRLSLLAFYGGSPLTPAAAAKILRKKNPQRVHHAETMLAAHLQKLYPRSSIEARRYVIHRDLPEVDWDADRDAPFAMPAGWP